MYCIETSYHTCGNEGPTLEALLQNGRFLVLDTSARIIGVLTGDIESSSELPQHVRTALPDILRAVGEDVRERFSTALPYPIDIFRGDSWQMAVVDPVAVLRVAMDMRCRLHAYHPDHPVVTRIAIGIGDVDFIPETSVSEGDGTAFRLSGQAIEAMDRRRHLAIRIAETGMPDERNSLPVLLTLMDALADRWTVRQSLAVSGALRGLTQEQIGSEWHPNPISQQAVAQHLDSAGWAALSEGLDYFERVVGSWAGAGSSDERSDDGGHR